MKKDPIIYGRGTSLVLSKRLISTLKLTFVLLLVSALQVSADNTSGTSLNNSNTTVEAAAPQARITVTGTVTDADGNAVVGAMVKEVGNNNNTVMVGANGGYTISVAGADSRLSFEFMGYTTQQSERVGNRTVINATLEQEMQDIEEVVVAAFAPVRRVTVTGSMESIDVQDLKVPTSSLTASFAGQMAGVIALTNSGAPGENNTQFYIRGISTFSGMTSPLVIIDGVQQSVGDLNTYDPDMIESFSILKDASATALYGSRGANGVMIVTTKTGRALDKPQITIRLEATWSETTKPAQFVDGARFMEMSNEAEHSRKTGNYLYPEEKIYGTAIKAHPYVFPDVDWYKEMFKRGSMNESATVSIRGGSEKMDYFTSIAFNNETGVLRTGNDFSFNSGLSAQRIVLQNNFGMAITPTTRLSVKINTTLKTTTGSHLSSSSVFSSVMNTNPVDYPVRWPKGASDFNVIIDGGTYEPTDVPYILWGGRGGGNYNGGFLNPYADMVSGYSEGFTSTVIGSVSLNQDFKFITPGLTANLLFSFKNYSSSSISRRFSGDYLGYNRFSASDWTWDEEMRHITHYDISLIGAENMSSLASPTASSGGDRQTYIEGMLNYDRNFGKHYVTGMVVYNQEQANNNSPSGILNSLPQRKQSVAGRLSYSYDLRYMFELNVGYNGSENFAKGHRFGVFPSVSAGWNISREKWFAPISNTVSNLKLRASYGLVGNDGPNLRFMYLSDVTLGAGVLNYRTGRDGAISNSGPSYNRFANNSLTWETARKLNVGIDLGLFRNALSISADVYTEDRSDIFLQRGKIPEISGLTPIMPAANGGRNDDLVTDIWGNLGRMRSWGTEISANFSKSFSADFHMSIKGTFTFSRNKVLEYDEPNFVQYPNMSRAGQKWGLHQMYIAERLFIDDAEVANSPRQNLGGTVAAGDIKYRDLPDVNGEYNNTIDANDMIWSKYGNTPEIVYGFYPNFRYKKWDFGFLLQGVANRQIMLSGFHPFGGMDRRGVLDWIAEDYWSETNANIHAKYPRLHPDNNSNNTPGSTYWLRDGAFLKLRNAEIGFSHKIFRIYLRGSNLLTFSKFKHWDPEFGGGSGLNRYPTQRVFNLGIQVNFK